MSVNVYGYDKIPYPYYISEFVKKLYHVDVLLHNNHYYLIRNMSTFASGEKSNRRKCYVCQYCLCYFVKKGRYDLHVELCIKGGHQYEFLHKDAAQLNFSNYSNIVLKREHRQQISLTQIFISSCPIVYMERL